MSHRFRRQKSRAGNESSEVEMLSGKIEKNVPVVGNSAQNSNNPFAKVPVQGHVNHKVCGSDLINISTDLVYNEYGL